MMDDLMMMEWFFASLQEPCQPALAVFGQSQEPQILETRLISPLKSSS